MFNPLKRFTALLMTAVLCGGAGCIKSGSPRSNVPTGISVKDYPKLRDVEHVPLRFDPDQIRFATAKPLKEWFEIEHTASCKKDASHPHAVVLSLKHETPSKNGWHFPKALPESVTANAGFDVMVVFEPHAIVLRGSQLDLRKDFPSEPQFYEMFFADVSNDDLVKLRDSTTAISYKLPGAELVLTPDQAETLRAFARVALKCGRL